MRRRSNPSARKLQRLAIAATMVSAGLAAWSPAATYVWDSTGSDFGTAGNWVNSGPPGSGDLAIFDPEGASPGTPVVNPIINSSQNANSLTIAPGQNLNGWTFTGNGTLNVGGSGSTGITTYGPQTTTLNGPGIAGPDTNDTVALNVTTDSTLVLAGNSTAYTNPGHVSVNGGTLVLDNTVFSTGNRINNATGTITVNGGGTVRLLGNPVFSVQQTVGLLAAGANTISGVNTFELDPVGNATEMDFTNSSASTFSTRPGSRAAYRFVTTSGNLGNSNGGIFNFIKGSPTLTYCGLLGNAVNTGGYAVTVDASGTNFATWNPSQGIVPLQESDVFTDPVDDHSVQDGNGLSLSAVTRGASAVGGSVQLNLDASATPIAATSQWNMGAMRVTVTGSSATLNMGTYGLAACALMLDGTGDLYINGSGMLGADGTRYVWVNNPNATLYIGLNVLGTGNYPPGKGPGNNPSVFCGPGFVVLTGTAIQGTDDDTTRFSIAGGVVRANNTQLDFTSDATLGIISFGGGVLEITNGSNGTGASADFTRTLGYTSAGQVNFGAHSGAEEGGGGFSAYGSNASVNIGGSATPQQLQWDETAFVPDGFPLNFGSSKSNAVLTFLNPIELDSGSAPYQLREIRVNRGTGGDKTVIAGVLSGASDADLIKTGTGTLELNQTNTYTGNTIVSQGQLLVSGSIASPLITVESGATLTVGSSGALASNAAVVDDGSVSFLANNSTGSPVATALSSFTIGASGSAAVAIPSGHGNRTILTLSSFLIAGSSATWTGRLDLTGNDLVIHNPNAANTAITLKNTFSQLKSGFAAGKWNGSTGICSSAAASDSTHLTALGVATALSSFDGETVLPTDVLVKYTYYGDANLDGTVNSSDYTQIDNGYLAHATGWSNGDFNYDGVINGSDYTLIDNAFNEQGGTLAAEFAGATNQLATIATGFSGAASAVPEPSMLGLFGMGGMVMLRRRRRLSTSGGGRTVNDWVNRA